VRKKGAAIRRHGHGRRRQICLRAGEERDHPPLRAWFARDAAMVCYSPTGTRRGGNEREVTGRKAAARTAPARAEPRRNEKIPAAWPRPALMAVRAELTTPSRQTNSPGCSPRAQWPGWSRQTNAPCISATFRIAIAFAGGTMSPTKNGFGRSNNYP
jgi:hypothetical protein